MKGRGKRARFCVSALAVALACAVAGLHGGEPDRPPPLAEASARFGWIDVFIDSGEQPLAAWQLEISASAAGPIFVGIEGGEHPAFADPPYYDPEAMMNDRVIIAALSTQPAPDLPRGKTRIARLHVRLGDNGGEPEWLPKLHTAAGPGGRIIHPHVSLAPGGQP